MSIRIVLPVVTSLVLTPGQSPCEGWTTPEFWAAVDPVTVGECISAGYSVDERSGEQDETPLHQAAALNDDPEVIRVLVDAGASLEAVTFDGRTPLHYAARWNGSPEVVRALLGHGANVYAENPYGRTPLHLAALFNESPGIVEELARVTDVNVRTNMGETPLHDAARRRWQGPMGGPNPAVVEVLLRHGADLEAETAGTVPARWVEDSRLIEMIQDEEARREAVRDQFVRYVTTWVAVGTIVLVVLGYLAARRGGVRRGYSDP